MKTALKEWAVVIEALARGYQIFLLRKGGIAEGKRGFELNHRDFLFFPTWEHQHIDLIRPEYHPLLRRLRPQQDDTLELRYRGQVTDVVPAPESFDQMRLLEQHHIWTHGQLQKRYHYRPDLALYLVIIRLYRLAAPASIPLEPRYAGCRSWVDLSADIAVEEGPPVLSEARFQQAREALFTGLQGLRLSQPLGAGRHPLR